LSSQLVRQLLDSGIHFGHRVSRWNPKMQPYIFGKRNLIHIINIKETLRGLLRAKKLLTKIVADGKDVLFVGTKRQARAVIAQHAQRCNMHYVAERWLGGTLTNFRTIRSRLARLEELENLEETGELANYSKKMIASLARERKKIARNLQGLRRMDKLPGVMVVVDVKREHIAVSEAKKLGIPTVCLIDTDSDPDFADVPIPGNDDSMRAIETVISELADAVLEGLAARPEEAPAQTPTAEQVPQPGPKPRPQRRPPARRGPAAPPQPPTQSEPETAEQPPGEEEPPQQAVEPQQMPRPEGQ